MIDPIAVGPAPAPSLVGEGYPKVPEALPPAPIEHAHYVARFARTESDLLQVLRLRYEVFNLELNEGLDENVELGLDLDRFDPGFHHLMVFDQSAGGLLVGTYRLQTATMARDQGFYSAGEFAIDQIPAWIREQSVELGRACVARSHRNRLVLFLLWKGLARYLQHNGMRFMFGCSSLSTMDPEIAEAMYRHLVVQGHQHPEVRVEALPGWAAPELPAELDLSHVEIDVPGLFRSYLRYGAQICGRPAIDREFKTVDFLMLFDLGSLDERRRRIYFGE
jgi:putative hemolysin